jgi:hypothetical protein
MRWRRRLLWLLVLPVTLGGIQAAHALGNAIVGAPESEVFASSESGAELLPFLVLGAAALVLLGFAARVAGLATPDRAAVRRITQTFVLLPPLGFAGLELGEAGFQPSRLHAAGFLVGLALQLPVGLVGYLLVRLLMRLGATLHRLLARGRHGERRSPSARARPARGSVPSALCRSSGGARAPPASFAT